MTTIKTTMTIDALINNLNGLKEVCTNNTLKEARKIFKEEAAPVLKALDSEAVNNIGRRKATTKKIFLTKIEDLTALLPTIEKAQAHKLAKEEEVKEEEMQEEVKEEVKEESVKDILSDAIAFCETGTLKEAKKIFLNNALPMLETLEDKVINTLVCSDMKTKKAFIEMLKSVIVRVDVLGTIEGSKEEEVQEEVQEDGKGKNEGDKKEPKKVDEKKLSALADEIKETLEAGQSAFLKVGELLTEAHHHFINKGLKVASWVEWADKHCCLKKAQAYNLMNVYKEYGNETDYHGTSMRVLYSLIRLKKKPEVDLKAIKEEAKEEAKNGNLDTKKLNEIVARHTKGITPPSDPQPSQKDIEIKKLKEEIENLKKSKPEKVIRRDNQEVEHLKATIESMKETIDALKDQLGKKSPKIDKVKEAFQKELQEKEEEIKKLKAEAKKPSETPATFEASKVLPYLPQFDSVEMSTRLGLDKAKMKDKKAIAKAYRALAILYPSVNNEKAAKQLKEARDVLTKAAK